VNSTLMHPLPLSTISINCLENDSARFPFHRLPGPATANAILDSSDCDDPHDPWGRSNSCYPNLGGLPNFPDPKGPSNRPNSLQRRSPHNRYRVTRKRTKLITVNNLSSRNN
jgi:hypothetical protein